MASITLTLPVAGTQITAGLHSSNYSALQTLLNGNLDNTNISTSAAIDPTKFAAGGQLGSSGVSFGASYVQMKPALSSSVIYAGLAADTTNRFSLDSDGRLQWGAGGVAALDTNFYRAGANVLQTDGALRVAGANASFNSIGTSSGQGIFTSSISGDTQNRFVINASGRMDWGSGSVAQDTNLYRGGAAVLQSDGAIVLANKTNGNYFQARPSLLSSVFYTSLAADTTNRFTIDADGRLQWGPGGSTALDVNLYRNTSAELATDQKFNLTGSGAAGDRLYLYKNGTNRYGLAIGSQELRIFSPDNGHTSFSKRSTSDGTTDTELARLDNDGKFYLGSALDAYFYRSNTATLQTDGNFAIGTSGSSVNLTVNGKGGIILNPNVTSGAIPLRLTIGSESVSRLQMGASGQLFWSDGSLATDTNLYRSSAALLRTDASFEAGGNVAVTAASGSAFLARGKTNNTVPMFAGNHSGDTTDRINIYSDRIDFGPGGVAAQDASIARVGTGQVRITNNLHVGATSSVLTSVGVFVGNGSAPSTPSAGGILYVASGALRYKGSSGTDTLIAAA